MLRSKFVAISGVDCGTDDPLRKFAVLHPLKRSTIRSLTSIEEDPDFALGGSSIANGKLDIAALSRKKLFDPLIYIAADCEPAKIQLYLTLYICRYHYQ